MHSLILPYPSKAKGKELDHLGGELDRCWASICGSAAVAQGAKRCSSPNCPDGFVGVMQEEMPVAPNAYSLILIFL